MKCSNCNETAEFKCDCQEPFMCPFHLGAHLMTQKNHSFENLDKEFGDLRLGQIRSKLIERIQKFNIAKIELASKSKSLIQLIQKAFKQASDNLNATIKKDIELLKRYKFCESELKIIEQIESLYINVLTFHADPISNLVKNTYSMDLITFENKRQGENINLKKEADEIIKKEQEAERKRTEAEEFKRKAVEEYRKIEDAKIEQASKIEEPRKIEKALTIEEVKKIEEAWMIKEAKKMEEARKLEELKNVRNMTLEQRINHYYSIVLQNSHLSLNWCQESCKELLVSDNGNFLFFCKVYQGIIQ